MSLIIYNNLTKKKEEFIPIEEGKVKLYVCGVTVYDDIHMGHARSMIVFDTLVRYLRFIGYDVTHVTNFTDVDDKIINKANKEGTDPLELSARYIERYFEDADSLGIKRADIYPKASESMAPIIEMIEEIIANGFAYPTPDGSVYFEVRKVKEYGKLSKQKLDSMESSGRVVLDEQKKDPMDFAVWKGAKSGECSWDSPWGKGRPGWHIECSAMIKQYLGDKIDIHGGGSDLIFPHHENEILQTEAVTHDMLANYWMHNGMLQVKDEKMSKSLNNFFRVRDVSKKFDSNTIRFYFLNTHYSSPLAYGEDMLTEAQSALKRLKNNYAELLDYSKKGPGADDDSCDILESARYRFMDAMNDDINTSIAIEVMFELARSTNKMMADKSLSKRTAAKIIKMIDEFNTILGILPEDDDMKDDGTADAAMGVLIELRKELRARKQYDLADMIRNKLAEAGIVLEDSADGMKWKKM
ncbi:cysteine--tRNA ligase [Candidatus Methanoplasma termitum]|nr:cysteine--tRNA ligase [Candidatus Methanoplasma termitum]MCL2333412.1 cysteine--tRNA ligase [Candidatus Methanoplasma sp.]